MLALDLDFHDPPLEASEPEDEDAGDEEVEEEDVVEEDDDEDVEEDDEDDESPLSLLELELALDLDFHDPPLDASEPEDEATVVVVGVSAEAVVIVEEDVDDDVEDDPDSEAAAADLNAPDVDDVDVRAELVSPDTSPLVSLVRDCGASSTAETFTDVGVELDEALAPVPDDADPPEPLKVAALASDSLDRDVLDFDALAPESPVLDESEVVGVEADALADASSDLAVLEAGSRDLGALVVESLEADGVDAAGVAAAAADVLGAAGVAAGGFAVDGVAVDGAGAAGAGAGAGVGSGVGAGGGALLDCTSAGLRPWMLSRPEALALTMAISPGLTRRRAPPSMVATSTDPSTTCTEAPVGSTVTLNVVPLTTAAR